MEEQNSAGGVSGEQKQPLTNTLAEMIERVKNEPKQNFIFSGIKDNKSLGMFVGPSKGGKTSACEHLAMSIASGEDTFLKLPLNIKNRKVLFISLEEFYSGRTDRNVKQSTPFIIKHGQEWLANYIVVNENMPTYIQNSEHWQTLEDVINKHKPGITFIDSFSRLAPGQIEDSAYAKQVMKQLRELVDKTKSPLCIIHHCHKLGGNPLTRDSIGGSSVIANELDYIFGINKTASGKRYLKEVDFRYCNSNSDTVIQFELDNNCLIKVLGETEEYKLLAEYDGRRDDGNATLIQEYISEKCTEDNITVVTAKELIAEFVTTTIMSRQTLYNNLGKLTDSGIIIKTDKAEYKVAA